MAYDGKLLARAREALECQREKNEQEHAARAARVYARVPEIERIERRMRRQMPVLVRLAVSHEPDKAERIAALREENLDLQIRRAELLTEYGWDSSYLEPIYSCEKCKDTGVFEDGVCSCLDKLYNRELTRELSALLQTGDESFENFRLELYSTEYLPEAGCSSRDCMKRVYDACRRFVDSFPNNSMNLLLQGGTGLGKTYLSACIAREIAKKGYSVCYDFCSGAIDAFETQKFGRDSAESERAALRVQRMLSCDLLILDDLGTEMLTQMASSALYTIINTRLVNRKCTIVSTNLSDAALAERYSSQISSRLLGEYRKLPFVGREDLRRNRKK